MERIEACRGAVGWGYNPKGCGINSRWCHWHNHSGRTTALGSNELLSEM